MKKHLALALSLTCLNLTAFGASALAHDAPKPQPPQVTAKSCAELAQQNPKDLPAKLCASLSLDEKISQMFMSYPPLAKTGPVTVGSVIMLGPTLKSPQTIQAKAQDLQKRAKIPLIVAVDMEGGQLNRLQNVPSLKDAPSGKALGSMTEADALAWGQKLGVEMKKLGLNCNLGPVLDLAGKGLMFEKERSMGTDPKQVATVAKAYVKGMWQSGVVGFGKHFPGYGETEKNSDHDLVMSFRSAEDIAKEAQPFFDLGDDLGGVLLTNIAFQECGVAPAILSQEIVSMAHQAFPNWVTMTDDIAVAPLLKATDGDAEEVVRRAFHAGNDIILTTAPIDWDKGLDVRKVILDEVKKDKSQERRIDQSVLRILRLKERMGLFQKKPSEKTTTPKASLPKSP